MTSSARPSDALHLVPSRALLALAMSLGLALAGCKTSQPGETTASLADADRQRSPEAWGERYRANPNDAEAALDYAGAAGTWPARPGGCGAGTGRDAEPAAPRLARCIRARARRCRALPAGARRVRARPGAGPAGLAHPLGPGRGARPAWPARGGAALLWHRIEDRTGRAVGVVEPRSLLRALQGPGARGGSSAAGRRPIADRCAGPAESRAGRGPAGAFLRSGEDRPVRPASRREERRCRLSAADAGAAERLETATADRPIRRQSPRRVISEATITRSPARPRQRPAPRSPGRVP